MKEYKKDNLSLYCDDCLKVFPQIPDKSVSMIFADPPYGTTQNKWDEIIPFADYVIVDGKKLYEKEFLLKAYQWGLDRKDAVWFWKSHCQHGLWYHMERVIKDDGIIALWCQSPFDKLLACSNLPLYRYEWIIEKTSPTGFLNANKMPMKCHENIMIFYKQLPSYYPQKTTGHERKVSKAEHKVNCKDSTNYNHHELRSYDSTDRFPRDVLTFKWDKQKESLHPTQKPLEACEYMIKTYTKENDMVLDFCMGSNTTGLAAKNLSRNYIGIESDENNFEISCKRIQ